MEHPKNWLSRIVCGALKETILIHGPITSKLIGSAAKRVAGQIHGELLKLEESNGKNPIRRNTTV